MATTSVRRIDRLQASIQPFLDFFNGPFSKLNENPDVSNFAVGNPLEKPMPAYVEALRDNLEPRRRNWFAYKVSEPKARITVARDLAARTGMPWDPEDVAMTNGGFAALAVAMRAVVEPGDEVIFLSPPWFFYEFMILAADADAVRLRLAPPAFEPDLDEIAAAITPRTRAMIFNTPHNPSGRVYPLETLSGRWPRVLTDASARIGHPIYLICDEPYNRILFDGRDFHSPAEVYPNTIVTYSYGKQLLAPGPADRVPDRAAHHAGPRARSARRCSWPRWRPATPSPTRCSSTRCRPRAAHHRHGGHAAAARPAGRGAARDRLRDDHARGHVLRHGPLADRPTTWPSPTSWPGTACWSCPARSSRFPAGSGSA